jgi:hypothetical protein
MKVTPEQLEKAVEAACEAGKLKDRFVANNLRVTVAAALASLPEPQSAEEMAVSVENHLSVYGTDKECDCRFHRALKSVDGAAGGAKKGNYVFNSLGGK